MRSWHAITLLTLGLTFAGCFVGSKTQPGQQTNVVTSAPIHAAIQVGPTSSPAFTDTTNFYVTAEAVWILAAGAFAIASVIATAIALGLRGHAKLTHTLAMRRELLHGQNN